MKYKYYDKSNRLIAESDSEIKFNFDLFPVFKDLKPEINTTIKQTDFYRRNKEEQK